MKLILFFALMTSSISYADMTLDVTCTTEVANYWISENRFIQILKNPEIGEQPWSTQDILSYSRDFSHRKGQLTWSHFIELADNTLLTINFTQNKRRRYFFSDGFLHGALTKDQEHAFVDCREPPESAF